MTDAITTLGYPGAAQDLCMASAPTYSSPFCQLAIRPITDPTNAAYRQAGNFPSRILSAGVNASRTWTHSLTMNGGSTQRVAQSTTSAPVTNNPAALAKSVSVYPNPSEGTFQLLRADAAAPAKITISNALGDVVYETVLPEGKKEATVELKNKISAGLYLVNMISNKERTVEKLVIR